MHLKNSLEIEQEQQIKEKEMIGNKPFLFNNDAIENERRQKEQFMLELQQEEQEKKLLLQAIINESESAGYPLPPSLIKLLNSNNGKKIKKNLSFMIIMFFFLYRRDAFINETEHSGLQHKYPSGEARNQRDPGQRHQD